MLSKPIRGARIDVTNPLARGLAGCWLMNEGTGDRIFDLSGNGNVGTFINTPEWVNTLDGFGLYFYPTDPDSINIGSYDLSQGFSVSTKVKLGSTLADRSPFGSSRVQLWMDNFSPDRFGIAIYDGAWQVRYGVIVPNATDYYTVGITYDGSVAKLFVNGLQDGADLSVTMTSGAVTTYIGQSDGLKFYYGNIKYNFLYSRGLTDIEMLRLHRDPYQIFDTGLNPAIFGGLTVATGRLSRYHNLNGLGGLGQQTFNPMG